MQRNQQDQNQSTSGGQARVRNVPIFVESRNEGEDSSIYPRTNHSKNESYEQQHNNSTRMSNDNQRYYPTEHHYQQDNHRHQNSYAPQHNNLRKDQYDKNSHGPWSNNDTSSIDITYKPDTQQRHNDYDNIKSRADAEKNRDRSRHNAKPGHRDLSDSANKENNKRPVSIQPDINHMSRDQANQQTNPEEEGRAKTPIIIPLPPPPSNQQTSEEGHKETCGENRPTPESTEHKKPKKDSDPLSIINFTKSEANKLLKEIASLSETSTQSKTYLRLEELLTRCILKLDDIECGDSQELKQQRKGVIQLIDKCSDILQRKVQLNHDIQLLFSKSI